MTKWALDDRLNLADELDATPNSLMARATVEYWAMRDALAAVGCK